MIASRTWHDRLPSAAAAIALQGGFLALLAFSFAVVRHVGVEKETFLTLPPLARPAPAPMMIDARGRKTIAPAIAPPPVQDNAAAPAIAAPPAPDNIVPLAPARQNAAVLPPQAQTDDIPLQPQSHVKNAPIWQSEIERRNTPPRVPCVSLTSNAVGMDGFAKEDHGARLDITCALKVLREGPALLPPVTGMPDPNPPRAHATDEAFAKALQAIADRKRALYPSAPQTGASP